MADWKKIEEDFEKNEMDFEQFRDEVIRFIWNNDKKGLRQLCENQIVTPLFFTEKAIEEISPGNEGNDVLYLMARELIGASPHVVGHLESALLSKKHLVKHPRGGKELLKSFVVIELKPDEFIEKLQLVTGTVKFMGLDELVRTNPNNTHSFVIQFLERNPSIANDNPRIFKMLSEMAQIYENCHHRSDLIELVKRMGGSPDPMGNIGGVQIFQGRTTIHDLEDEAREIRKMLATGDHQSALSKYEKLIPKMDTIYANSIPMGGTEYPNVLLFSGVMLALNNKTVEAQKLFMKCTEKRYRFGDLLLLNVDALRENAALVRKALARLSADEPSHLAFEKFFKLASGHDYAKVNELYDHFLEVVGDREMDEAFELSEQLLIQYHEKRNPLVPSSLCETMVRIFRTCHFVIQGDMAQAEQEYIFGAQGQVAPADLHRNFVKLAAHPEKMLDHYFGS